MGSVHEGSICPPSPYVAAVAQLCVAQSGSTPVWIPHGGGSGKHGVTLRSDLVVLSVVFSGGGLRTVGRTWLCAPSPQSRLSQGNSGRG